MPTSINKKEILAKLHQLPSLPLVVQEIISSFSDVDLNTISLAYNISQDQGLSAKVLRIANSTFYGLSRKVGSIEDAIIVLGFDTIRSLVLSAGMVQTFPPSSGNLFDRNAYWRRSFRVAAISKALAKNLQQKRKLAFTAGMFYDIGQLVMDLCIPQQFAELLQQQTSAELSLMELERSRLGFDHADIGAELIRLWNFPPEIEQVVRYWRDPTLQETIDPLVCVVHMASLLESGVSKEDLIERLPKTWCGQLQLTLEYIETKLPHPEQLEDAANLALTG